MVNLSEDVLNRISKEDYYTKECFIEDVKCYLKAVKSGRILYTVTSVSRSGMSRNILIKSFEGTMRKGSYRTYYNFLKILGFRFVNNSDSIRVSGCGMNMLFATNYNIIHKLHKLGFIGKHQCEILAQNVN